MNLKGKRINFLGDSITFGAGLMEMPDLPELPKFNTEEFDPSMLDPANDPFLSVDPDEFEDLFVNILRRECSLAEARNYGVPGTRIARQQPGVFDMFPECFCDRVDRMDPDADVVIVFGGTNDFGHGNAPMGTMADRTDRTFYGALHVMMIKLIEKYPVSEIVICTPLHRVGEEDPLGDGSKNEPGSVLIEYVNAIRQVAEYYSLPLLDLYAVSSIQPNIPAVAERYCPDGLHPNKAGNELLARRIRSFLEAL